MFERGMRTFLLLGSLVVLTACQKEGSFFGKDSLVLNGQKDAVVYGEDSRKDDYELSTAILKEQAQKTFAVMPKSNLHQVSEMFYLVQGQSLQEADQLCEGQKFSSQVVSASCTATLVEPDLMLTAGHCFPREASCEELVFTNQFVTQTESDKGHNLIETKDVYSCKEVEYLSLERGTNNYDFAFIRLDRAVSDVQPIDISKARDPVTFEKVGNFSFPAGLPRKHIEGSVKDSGIDEIHFYADLDTFVGSSGSMVYSGLDNSPLGILVGGAHDYEDDTEGQCRKVKICEDGQCNGERILKLTEINKLMSTLTTEDF